MESKINDYAKFVDTTTSDTSKDTTKMCDRVEYLRGTYSMKGSEVIDQEIDMLVNKWKENGMYLSDLSCCDTECVC